MFLSKEISEDIKRLSYDICNRHIEFRLWVVHKVIVGCYNNYGQFNEDKIIFVFKTCDEVSGIINTTKSKKNVIEKYENGKI